MIFISKKEKKYRKYNICDNMEAISGQLTVDNQMQL